MNLPSWRLGSTSYVYPDELAPNVRQLSGTVQDVELVLFETGSYSNFPDPATTAELRRLADAGGLSYTVHLPLDIRPHDPEDPAGPSLSMRQARRVIEATNPLQPWAYVAHLDGKAELSQGASADWAAWRKRSAGALQELVDAIGAPEQLCIENLERYPEEELYPILDMLPIGLCLDAGHLWLMGLDPVQAFLRFRSRIRVIHLHGIGERDHSSLALQPVEQVHAFLDALHAESYAGVLTLEVFGCEDFFGSQAIVQHWANNGHEPK